MTLAGERRPRQPPRARSRLALAWAAAGAVMVAACADKSPTGERLQGTVELEERRLAFPLGGVLVSLSVQEGQPLAAGAALAAIDAQAERAQRDGRAAELAAAEARRALLHAGSRAEVIAQVQARIAGAQVAERGARLRLDDERSLSRAGVTPAAVVIDREAAFAEAQAVRESLEQELRALVRGARPQELSAADATVAAARAALAASEVRLAQHALVAPVAGVVLDVHARPGEVVTAGMPVVTIGDPSRPYVDVFVPQGHRPPVEVGTLVEVRVDARARPLPGVVEHVARRAEFTPTYVFSDRERPNLVLRTRIRIKVPAAQALPAGVPAFVSVVGQS